MKRKYWILWILSAALVFTACSGGYQVVVTGSSGALAGESAADASFGDRENGTAEKTSSGDRGNGMTEKTSSGDQDGGMTEKAVPLICVYVCGAVNRPGVYQLAEGSRVCDALRCAGGLREDADDRSLNQARILGDGEQITVLTGEEAKSGGITGNGVEQSADSLPGDGSSGEGPAARVNINTAGKEELMTLPGVGEARAEAIIAYRGENGKFQSAEDIMKIEGNKEKLFAKLQDKICV